MNVLESGETTVADLESLRVVLAQVTRRQFDSDFLSTLQYNKLKAEERASKGKPVSTLKL